MKGHPEQALIHDTVEPNELWHRRLAHVHYRALPLAITKKTFPSSERKEKGILEIIHSDVWGPMPSRSLSGYVYYVSFINDFSR